MAQSDTPGFDVIILGGGLNGMTLALALDKHGLSTAVVDHADLASTIAPDFDGRASAVAAAPMRMLNAIGIGARLDGLGCPITAIRISDGLKPGRLQFDADPDGGPLGHMFENRALRRALLDAATEARHLTLRAPASVADLSRDMHGARVTLTDGTVLRAPLVVAAEGRRSATREAAGIRVARWSYDHRAIVTMIEHDRPHGNIAYEIFYPAGPFAILPMLPGTRSAIVWTVDEAVADATLALPDRALSAEIAKRMGGFLGEVKLLSRPFSYPLGFHRAERIIDERLALVGDAAHGIHPIAGQGLNLGFRDIAALTEVLVESARLGLDLGSPAVLERYARWRGLDTMMVAASTDLLTRLFGVRGKTAAAVRRFGIGGVQRMPALKQRFMAEARGESGELPALLRGLAI